jgi:PAS domain S-box-containing protein
MSASLWRFDAAAPRPSSPGRRGALPWPAPVLTALLALCLLAAAATPVWAEPPAVLILNSYHQGEDWSDNELAGILPVLRAIHLDLVPTVEHLDTKRFPGPAHLELLGRFLAEKYRDRRLDLIMVLDNPALDLLTAHRAELFPGVPVVFAGINGYTPAMIAGQENITGVAEEQDMAGTLRMALQLRPNTKTILAIHDHTASGLAVRRDMEEAQREGWAEFVGRVKIVFTPKQPISELEATLRALPGDAMVVILSYVTDGAGRTFTRAESTRLITRASPVPVLCMHETRLGYGTLGGALLSGQDHGRKAAEMALRVLAGEPAGSIPVDDSGGFRPMFDHVALERFAISDSDLPPGSLVINRPVSFYEQNRRLVQAALAVAALMLLLIIMLAAALLRGRRAEAALRLSELRYRELVDSAGDLVFSHDRHGTLLGVNPAVTAILGYEPREIAGRKPYDFMRAEHTRAFDEKYLAPLLIRGQASGVSCYLHKNGAQRYLEYRSQVVRPAGGEPFVSVVARDVTARVLQERRLRQLEDQLRHSQKMEAVGTLAGGIAHDFNNILGAVLGFAELALDSAQEGQSNDEELRQITVAAERARRLVSRLLAFSRKLEPQTQTMDLNQEVVHALEMLSPTIPKMVALERDLEPELWPVQADPNQMEQVLINLGANAVDAMPEGGRLTFTTVNLALTPEESRLHHELFPGDYVLLTVSDTGQGIDSRLQEQIFDPFFTTKEVGKGTGLGLAMVYGIVKEHCGHVFCESQPGRGSTFSIYLPAAPGRELSARGGPATLPPPGGSENLLLVDDEGMLRALGERILGAAGYSVQMAASGEEALLALANSARPVDLVVLDLGMPGMGGLKCLERILALDPASKVVIASGYAANGPVRQALLAGAAGFVAKPYGRFDLLSTVRGVLDSPRPA